MRRLLLLLVIAASAHAQTGRLELRVLSVMADTIRPPAVLVAANAPPVAVGLLQERTYLHSGEIEIAAVDLDAGGRAGWNVVIGRTYRSATIGLSPLGMRQEWATGEHATFTYSGANARSRCRSATLTPGAPATTPVDRVHTFVFDKGVLKSSKLDGVRETTLGYDVAGGAPGLVVKSTTTAGITRLFGIVSVRVERPGDPLVIEQIFAYDATGRLERATEKKGPDQIVTGHTYDVMGRRTSSTTNGLISWKTADTEVTWGAFDLAGKPKESRQKRFRDQSGLKPNPVLLDEVVQQHRWNEHGERTQFSMPVADGVVLGAGWTRWLQQSYDAMGNVTAIARIDDDLGTTAPLPVMTASYRGAGRPDVRTLITSGGPIVRAYDYHATTSLLSKVEVTAKGVPIAGTAVKHDGLQTSEARLLGMASDERLSLFAYDVRSRLAASIFGTKRAVDPTVPVPGSAREQMNPADFRKAQERTKVLKPLATVDGSKIDPPTATFDEKPGGGHKIDKVTSGFLVRPFGYDGAERIDDGRFVYTFDARGRLIRATEKSIVPPIRRVLYTYTGAGRLVGRRAEYANVANPAPVDWKLEDRAQILTNDGLPAETTFAWDPITDRLLAVYGAGATHSPLKQIIHGESAYDDPLETTTIDPSTGAIIRLYPIYDEAGTGSLQTVLNSRAEVVARNLTNDPYGAHDLALTGAAIDGAAIRARKSSTGALTGIDVELHATEQLSLATLPLGVRLAAIDVSGAVVRIAATTPSLAPDAYTVRWTLTPTEWSALTAPPATTLSIAATQHLGNRFVV